MVKRIKGSRSRDRRETLLCKYTAFRYLPSRHPRKRTKVGERGREEARGRRKKKPFSFIIQNCCSIGVCTSVCCVKMERTLPVPFAQLFLDSLCPISYSTKDILHAFTSLAASSSLSSSAPTRACTHTCTNTNTHSRWTGLFCKVRCKMFYCVTFYFIQSTERSLYGFAAFWLQFMTNIVNCLCIL